MKNDIKNLGIIVENMNKLIVYHVTSSRYLENIKRVGLIPKIPQDYGEDGDELGVYCFPNIDETTNALWNWLGERIEDWEEETGEEYNECVLKLDITGLSIKQDHGIDWEVIVTEPIPPNRILEVLYI